MFFPDCFKVGGKPVTSQDIAEMVGLSYDTYTGRRISPQLSMQLTSVFSCVRVLAESVGMLPCGLFEQLDRGNRRAVKERLHKLLSVKPNGYMTPQEFWELLVGCLCLRGNFYAYKVKALGKWSSCCHLIPAALSPAGFRLEPGLSGYLS